MAQRINPETIRLIKKYSWINNWATKKNYIKLFYKDFLIKTLLLNSINNKNIIKYNEEIKTFNYEEKFEIITLDHFRVSQYYLNNQDLNLFNEAYNIENKNYLITDYFDEQKNSLFIKFFFNEIYSYRNSNCLKLYYLYYLNKEYLFELYEENNELNELRNNYIEHKFIHIIYRSYIKFLYYLQNNIEIIDLSNVSIIPIRKLKFSKTLNFLMVLINSYLSQKYKLTEVFDNLLKKIYFYSLIKPWSGIKIVISGKPHQKLRKTTLTYNYGSFKSNTINSNLNYLCTTSYNTHGAYGIKIWMSLTKVNKVKLYPYKYKNK